MPYPNKRVQKTIAKNRAKRKSTHDERLAQFVSEVRSRNWAHSQNHAKYNPTLGETKEIVLVKAPTNFSFIDNTEEVLSFFKLIKDNIDAGYDISLDLEDVSSMTCDTVAILLAQLSDKNYRKAARIFGNLPHKEELRSMIEDTGYLHHVIKGYPKPNNDNSLIFCKKNKRVEPKVAQKARIIASKHTFGDVTKKISSLQGTLIECMGNTRNHASGENAQEEPWWLLVYSNPATKITSFSFVDTGVGIFSSITKAALNGEISSHFAYDPHPLLLKRILNGEITSSTGEGCRGLGLPKINSYCRNRKIRNLKIISNDVWSSVYENEYKTINEHFSGTFLYWEIHPN